MTDDRPSAKPVPGAGRQESAFRRTGTSNARQRKRGFAMLAGIFMCLLLVSLAASYAAIEVVDATRAYATGEGRYSKAQKLAVLHLYRLALTGQERHYEAFQKVIAVPRGDRAARIALEAGEVDLRAAREGFLNGENHPDDINGMIRLFRLFSWWGPFAAAVDDWRTGDELVAELLDLGGELRTRMDDPDFSTGESAAILRRLDAIDGELTHLEDTFSTHMGEAARSAALLVVLGLGGTTILLWGIGMLFASRLLRGQLALDHKLAVSESRFRDYAEVASDWYWETDRQHRLTYLSDRFFDSIDMTPDAVLGHSVPDLLRASHDTEIPDGTLPAFDGRKPFRDVRIRLPRRGDDHGYWSLAGKPRIDAEGNYLGYRGIGTDITATVSNAMALRLARDQATLANRAKSEFLANMSHELRTPLNAILGFSEIIRDRVLGTSAVQRHSEYAGDIHASGAHLLAIIDEILDLSKIESGNAELDESEVTVGAVLDGTLLLLGEEDGRAQLLLAVDDAQRSIGLRIDERKFKQALVNLLTNALKFTRPGGSVELFTVTGQTCAFGIGVRDTGIGMTAEGIETALTAFGQVASAYNRGHSGTGLGLPLTRALIELHGGRLSLESRVGIGTTATLWLPPERLVTQTRGSDRAGHRQRVSVVPDNG